jgi:hypothetical protein
VPSDFNWDINVLFSENFGPSFGNDGDELPNGRKKFNHAQGVVGQITWEEVVGHPYTGLYKGKTNGIIRLSEGNFAPLPETNGLTPTIALKFPRTGKPSVNHLANTSFEPSTSFNFFKNDFKVRIPLFTDTCAIQTIERRFLDQNPTISSLGLSEFSRFDVNGIAVTFIVFPFDLRFSPVTAIKTKFPDTRQKDAAGVEIPWYKQVQTMTSAVTTTSSMILF